MLTAIKDVITDPNTPMPNSVRDEIRRIANYRWKQMMEPESGKQEKGQPAKDIYLTGFVLDPREFLLSVLRFAILTSHHCTGFRNSDILRQHSANPLAIQPIRLNGQRPTRAPLSTNEYPKLVKRAGNFLVSLLRIEYEERKASICNLRADEALDLLKEQFGQYYRAEAPFNRPVIGDEGPHEWWEALNCDRSHRTQPIAVS